MPVSEMMKVLDRTLLSNTLGEWSIAALVTVLAYALLALVKRGASAKLRALATKTSTALDDMIVDVMAHTRPFFFIALSVFVGSMMLTLPPNAENAVRNLAALAFLFQAAIWGGRGVTLWIKDYTGRKGEMDSSSITTITFAGYMARLVIWSLALLLALDNLGVNITALVAGMGIGGIAVALAAQNILGDLFASISIVLDKPFVINDFIIVGDYMGSVEHIGVKTTRIRSLSGEQIVFSNTDLLNSRVRNFKRMVERRVVFSFGVVYGTPAEKLEAIPGIVRGIIEAIDGTRFDRAHFAKYGDSSLDFEVVYFVVTGDYNVYMDIQQAINLAIYRSFEDEGLGFAFPTQTIFLGNELKAAHAGVSIAGGEDA
ncbi:MAG TPA: mechanosensitive ion channel family protein [Nitrospirota bacterium]